MLPKTFSCILNFICTDNSQGSVLRWFTAISPLFQGVRKTLLPYSYLTQYTPPPVPPRCANEYFSKSKWILLLSQTCWHRLHRYRWGISGGHAQNTGVMYQDIVGLGHVSFFFFCSNKRRSHGEDLLLQRTSEGLWLLFRCCHSYL